jgi:hypothetical protein
MCVVRVAMIIGAIGVILVNSENNTFAIPMPKDSNIKIPSMVVSSSDGAKILGTIYNIYTRVIHIILYVLICYYCVMLRYVVKVC